MIVPCCRTPADELQHLFYEHNDDSSIRNPDERGLTAKERYDKLLNVLNIRKKITSRTPPPFLKW
jgi:hypothetical protein